MDINTMKTFLVVNNVFYADIENRKNFYGYYFQLFRGYINYKVVNNHYI